MSSRVDFRTGLVITGDFSSGVLVAENNVFIVPGRTWPIGTSGGTIIEDLQIAFRKPGTNEFHFISGQYGANNVTRISRESGRVIIWRGGTGSPLDDRGLIHELRVDPVNAGSSLQFRNLPLQGDHLPAGTVYRDGNRLCIVT